VIGCIITRATEIGRDALIKLNQSLIAASAEGDHQAVGKLIDDGAFVDWIAAAGSTSGNGSALHCASRHGHEEAVRLLLEVCVVELY
jgi:ankyrin repeat protein